MILYLHLWKTVRFRLSMHEYSVRYAYVALRIKLSQRNKFRMATAAILNNTSNNQIRYDVSKLKHLVLELFYCDRDSKSIQLSLHRNGWMDRWMDGWMVEVKHKNPTHTYSHMFQMLIMDKWLESNGLRWQTAKPCIKINRCHSPADTQVVRQCISFISYLPPQFR